MASLMTFVLTPTCVISPLLNIAILTTYYRRGELESPEFL